MAPATPEEEPEFPLPRRFGRYTLFDRIGRGGMAEIYLARNTTQMGGARLAVIKLVLNRFASDPAFESKLISEARLAAGLSHANIVHTYDLGREEARLYIAMEYVEGYDLTQLQKKLAAKKLGLPAEFGFLIVMEVLRALDYAHRRADDEGRPLGIVHRDVSPSNVLISLEGEVKLCDFGIARAVHDITELPEGAMEGKAAYMAPEHARGERVDARADVFAASTILWEMMAGRRMYKAQPGRDVLEIARAGEVPPLPRRGLPDPEKLEAILARGLAKNRDDRYPSAGAMLRDVEDYVRGAKLTASPLRFGAFLTEHFETELVAVRRERERAALSVTVANPIEILPQMPTPAPPEPMPALAAPATPSPTVEPALTKPVTPDTSGPPTGFSPLTAPPPPTKTEGEPSRGRTIAIVALAAAVVLGVVVALVGMR